MGFAASGDFGALTAAALRAHGLACEPWPRPRAPRRRALGDAWARLARHSPGSFAGPMRPDDGMTVLVYRYARGRHEPLGRHDDQRNWRDRALALLEDATGASALRTPLRVELVGPRAALLDAFSAEHGWVAWTLVGADDLRDRLLLRADTPAAIAAHPDAASLMDELLVHEQLHCALATHADPPSGAYELDLVTAAEEAAVNYLALGALTLTSSGTGGDLYVRALARGYGRQLSVMLDELGEPSSATLARVFEFACLSLAAGDDRDTARLLNELCGRRRSPQTWQRALGHVDH